MMNRRPKKLSQLNDITRIKTVFIGEEGKDVKTYMPRVTRQNIVLTKFSSNEMNCIFDQLVFTNVMGRISLPTIFSNLA